MAGRERPSELRQARLTIGPAGDPRWLAAIVGLDPVDPRDLEAPPGSVAELIEPPRERNFGDDFGSRSVMVCWLRITAPDGRSATRQVYFERDVLALRERPEELLLAEIQRYVGEADSLRLYDRVAANVPHGDSALDLALEPVAISDPSLKAAWWELFGFLDRVRLLEASPADGGRDAKRLVIQGQWAGFRAGLRAGRHWREAELRQCLRPMYELGVASDLPQQGRQASATALNGPEMERALRTEQVLFAIWSQRREEFKRRRLTVKGVLTEVLLIFAEEQAALPPRARLVLPKKKNPDAPLISDDRGRKMLKAWRDGHDPIAKGMTWEAFNREA